MFTRGKRRTRAEAGLRCRRDPPQRHRAGWGVRGPPTSLESGTDSRPSSRTDTGRHTPRPPQGPPRQPVERNPGPRPTAFTQPAVRRPPLLLCEARRKPRISSELGSVVLQPPPQILVTCVCSSVSSALQAGDSRRTRAVGLRLSPSLEASVVPGTRWVLSTRRPVTPGRWRWRAHVGLASCKVEITSFLRMEAVRAWTVPGCAGKERGRDGGGGPKLTSSQAELLTEQPLTRKACRRRAEKIFYN